MYLLPIVSSSIFCDENIIPALFSTKHLYVPESMGLTFLITRLSCIPAESSVLPSFSQNRLLMTGLPNTALNHAFSPTISVPSSILSPKTTLWDLTGVLNFSEPEKAFHSPSSSHRYIKQLLVSKYSQFRQVFYHLIVN